MQLAVEGIPESMDHCQVRRILRKAICSPQQPIHVFKNRSRPSAVVTVLDSRMGHELIKLSESDDVHNFRIQKSGAGDKLILKSLRDGLTALDDGDEPPEPLELSEVAFGCWKEYAGPARSMQDGYIFSTEYVTRQRSLRMFWNSRDCIEIANDEKKIVIDPSSVLEIFSHSDEADVYLHLSQQPKFGTTSGSQDHDVSAEALQNATSISELIQAGGHLGFNQLFERATCIERGHHSRFMEGCLVIALRFAQLKGNAGAAGDPRLQQFFASKTTGGPPVPRGMRVGRVVKGTCFSEDIVARFDKWMATLPLVVAYQCTIIAQSGIIFPGELLALKEPIESLFEAGSWAAAIILKSLLLSATEARRRRRPRPNLDSELKRLKSEGCYDSFAWARDPENRSHCVLHQLVVTPTRKILRGPFIDSSNRVIRNFRDHNDHFLRVVFVEEDETSTIYNEWFDLLGVNTLFYKRLNDVLKEGVKVAGREFKFLGFSSSSLRTGSLLVFNIPPGKKNRVRPNSIRAWMGDFSHIKCAPRYAARMGQTFSATVSTVEVQPDEVHEIPDIKRNGFCFSDGVGTISLEMAKDVWRSLSGKRHNGDRYVISEDGAEHLRLEDDDLFKDMPHAYQIRFGGAKGMISVDPSLSGRQLCLRPSMIKFQAKNSMSLEIASDSTACRTALLNRQAITILESLGVPAAVFIRLQSLAISSLCDMWESPRKLLSLAGAGNFGGIIRSMWRSVASEGPGPVNNFIKACFEHTRLFALKEIKFRARVEVPRGWTLYGVLDETDTLNAGEIYVNLEPEAPGGRRGELSGQILIYRSPCVHPGDVQFAQAVRNPLLAHLKNCVVFSRRGKRDLPSMLAGGDLDGDLYTVIEDSDLFPATNLIQKAAKVTPTEPVNLDSPVEMNDIADFVVEFLLSNNLGKIAVRHLALADQRQLGVLDPKCVELALLHSTAVDFAKTGHQVENRAIAHVDVYPDFMMKEDEINSKTHRLFYKSEKAMGVMFRDKKLNELVSRPAPVVPQHPDTDDGIWGLILERAAVGDGWKACVDRARQYQVNFDHEVFRIISACGRGGGRATELDLFTGSVLTTWQRRGLAQWAVDEFEHAVHGAVRLIISEVGRSGGGGGGGDAAGIHRLKCMAVACYFVSNVEEWPDDGFRTRSFGFILLRRLFSSW